MILAQVASTTEPCGITSVMRGIAAHWGSPTCQGSLAGFAQPGDRIFEGWRFRRKILRGLPGPARTELGAWLRSTEAGVLLAHYPPLDAPALSAARRLGIKTAYYYHNVTDPSLYEGEERSRREDEDAAMLALLPTVDAVFCNSAFTADKIRRMTRCEAVVAPPAVDTKLFHPAESKDEGIFRLVHVGRAVPHKGARELFSLMRRLVDTHGHVEFHYVGRIGEETYGTQCQALLEHPRIHWWEHLSDATMVNVLMKSHAFASASRFEGFGMPFLEAAACGLPSVGYAVSGIPEAVVEGVTGRLVPEGDLAAMEAVLEGWIRNPEEAHRLGISARRHAEACTWDRSVSIIRRGLGLSAVGGAR
ncbi:MAG: glycosyltransferase family 4 protein [Planctomycetota bacterium]